MTSTKTFPQLGSDNADPQDEKVRAPDVKPREVVAVVAYQQEDRAIGFCNRLIYRLREDMEHFRKLTTGHVVLMGRRTYESVGRNLPRRVNVVMSRSPKPKHMSDNSFWCSDLEYALAWCSENHPEKTVFIIGGEEIYRLALPYLDKVVATEIENRDHLQADAFFPDLPEGDFELVYPGKQQTGRDALSCQDVSYRIATWERKHRNPVPSNKDSNPKF